jgi:hypothetical protein
LPRWRAVAAPAADFRRRAARLVGKDRSGHCWAVTEESEHTAGRDGTAGCAVAAACSLLFLSSTHYSPPFPHLRLAAGPARANLPPPRAATAPGRPALISTAHQPGCHCMPLAAQFCVHSSLCKFLFLGGWVRYGAARAYAFLARIPSLFARYENAFALINLFVFSEGFQPLSAARSLVR